MIRSAVAFLVTIAAVVAFFAWLCGEKQYTRLPPDKHGYRAPQFLMFERATGEMLAGIGVMLYAAMLIGTIVWGLLT